MNLGFLLNELMTILYVYEILIWLGNLYLRELGFGYANFI